MSLITENYVSKDILIGRTLTSIKYVCLNTKSNFHIFLEALENQVDDQAEKSHPSNKKLKGTLMLPDISSNETISLIQSALQPEIERRLEARRNMDKLAVETLIKFSDQHLRTNQVDQVSLTEEQHDLCLNKDDEACGEELL